MQNEDVFEPRKVCRFCVPWLFHVFAFLISNACHLRSFNMILHEKFWWFFSLQLGASYELDHPGYKRIKFVVHWWWPSQVQSPWRVSRRPRRQTSPWYHQLHRLRYDDAVELIPSVAAREMEVVAVVPKKAAGVETKMADFCEGCKSCFLKLLVRQIAVLTRKWRKEINNVYTREIPCHALACLQGLKGKGRKKSHFHWSVKKWFQENLADFGPQIANWFESLTDIDAEYIPGSPEQPIFDG